MNCETKISSNTGLGKLVYGNDYFCRINLIEKKFNYWRCWLNCRGKKGIRRRDWWQIKCLKVANRFISSNTHLELFLLFGKFLIGSSLNMCVCKVCSSFMIEQRKNKMIKVYVSDSLHQGSKSCDAWHDDNVKPQFLWSMTNHDVFQNMT